MVKVFHDLVLRPRQKESALIKLCERKLRAPCRHFKILKKSLDARDKSDIKWIYTVECASHPVQREARVFPQVRGVPRVAIAGMGPAGLFCALRLLDYGVRPVLLERGKRVEERAQDVRRFCLTGDFCPSSNIQFGEGGAGAFSDGKLNTQTNSPLNREVLETFVRFGAPEEVAYLGKPHVGSDRLKDVVANMRRAILAGGGTVRYQSVLDDVRLRDGRLAEICVNGAPEPCDALVLAVGHSARDTFEMLLARGFVIEQKEFAAGVRIEHLQSAVGRAQYGAGYAALPAADYRLVSHASERAVFTFCMCPGGVVVPAASEEGGVVTNGMSDYARDGKNANAALVVQVRREDFGSEHPLAGVAFQRKLERAAYLAAGGGFKAPVQLTGDFLCDRESYYFGEVKPTYAPATAFVPLRAVLPPVMVQALKAAIPDMNAKLAGFGAYESVLTGVETRTSSPVRIVRDDTLQAVRAQGVYPCGEGCGYAGGITSAAADGLRVAEQIARTLLARE